MFPRATWPRKLPGFGTSAPPVTFNYYIAPNGDDNNNGLTPATAWSITALNTKQSTYAGKNIGIIGDVGGTQTPIQYGTVGGVQTTIYSMMQTINGAGQNSAITVNGGTSSASTYLGSCTSSGVYRAQWAIIDGAQPGTGDLPVGQYAGILGQPFYETTPVANPGYVTLDGLIVRNGNYSNVLFGDIQGTVLNGVVIQNCEIYNNVCTTSAENPGGIFLGTTNGAQVLNCLIHDCLNSGGGFVPGTGGITTYAATGLIVTGCTFYRNGYAIQNKDGNQWGTYSYNYMDVGQLGSYSGEADACCVKSCVPGTSQTLTMHHNVFVGAGAYWGFGADSLKISGSASMYNNTMYTATQEGWINWLNCNSGAGPFPFYNNVVWYHSYGFSGNGSEAFYQQSASTGLSASTLNYNYYGTSMNFELLTTTYTPTTWQALGYDANSIFSATSPFLATPSFRTPSSFAVTGAALTGSNTGGIMGANDGSGTIGSTLTPSS